MLSQPSSRSSRASGDLYGAGALASAGMLAAHQLGYLAESASVASHRHLSILAPVALLAVSVAGLIAAVRIVERDPGRAPSWAQLTVAQSVLFLVMETAEYLAAGSVASMWSTPVLAGLALQPIVARLALSLLAAGHRTLEALLTRPTLPSPLLVVFAAEGNARQRPQRTTSLLRLRGPPIV